MTKIQQGTIKALSRYPEKGAPKVVEQKIILKENFGIEGDRHADGGERQIALISVSEKEWMEKQDIKGFCFKKYKENILLEGVSFAECKAGDLLTCGEVILEMTEVMKGCYPDLCRLADNPEKCILAGSSRFAKVKKGGAMEVGMPVVITILDDKNKYGKTDNFNS